MKLTLLPACLRAAATAAGMAAQPADLASEGKSWWAHIQYLADDKLEGRNVGTPGFDTAVEYVENQFQTIGLKPAGTAGFRQPVTLESRVLVPDRSKLALVRDGHEVPLVLGEDAALSPRGELDGSTEASMVFVGYGMSIPEAGWDDFAGLDLRGKVAVYVNAFPPVKVSDNVKSHVNTADERWLALKHVGAIGVATIAAPRPPTAAAAPAAPPTPATAAPPPGAASNAPAPGAGGAGGAGRGGGTPQPLITLFDRALNDAAGEIVAMTLTPRGAAAVLDGTGHTIDEINQLVADSKPLPRFALPGFLKAQAAL